MNSSVSRIASPTALSDADLVALDVTLCVAREGECVDRASDARVIRREPSRIERSTDLGLRRPLRCRQEKLEENELVHALCCEDFVGNQVQVLATSLVLSWESTRRSDWTRAG